MQIFHAVWLVDEDGRNPEPYTLVTAADIEAGRWRANPAVAETLGLEPEYAERHLLHYMRALDASGKYRLTIWPYHAMLGGIGHALVSAVEEAALLPRDRAAVAAQLPAEGELAADRALLDVGPRGRPTSPRASRSPAQPALIDGCSQFDAVVIAGQAKSHCVAWTIEDLPRPDAVQERRARRRRSTCSRTAPRRWSCPARSTTPRRPMPTSPASPSPARTSYARTLPIEEWPGDRRRFGSPA